MPLDNRPPAIWVLVAVMVRAPFVHEAMILEKPYDLSSFDHDDYSNSDYYKYYC